MFRKKIDPANLNKKTEQLLWSLLANNQGVVFFNTVDEEGKPKKYRIPAANGKYDTVTLAAPVVRYARKKNPHEHRYAVVGTRLGEGAQGVVHESSITLKHVIENGDVKLASKKKSADKTRAIKFFTDSGSAQHEYDFLHAMPARHAKFVEATEPVCNAVFMRRLSGRELIDYLIEDAGKFVKDKYVPGTGNIFTVDQRIQLTIMIAEAIIRVHDAGIIHRDIKGDNFMVVLDADHNPVSVELFDFNLSKWKSEDNHDCVGTSKPIDYRSPEVKYAMNADEKSDAYSFAVLLENIIWQCLLTDSRYNSLSQQQKVRMSVLIQNGMRDNPNQRLSLLGMVKELKAIQEDRLQMHRQLKPC